MNVFNSFFLFFLFGLSIFTLSCSFVNPCTPTLYLSLSGCFVMVIVVLTKNYKKQTLILSLSEMLFVGFILFSILNGYFLRSLNFELIISEFSLLLLYFLVRKLNLNYELIFVGIVILGLTEANYGLGQYFDWFKNSSFKYHMNGSFDNPAGYAAALSVVFTYALFLLSKTNVYWRAAGCIASLVFIVAVALSKSRAGIISIIIVSGIWLLWKINFKWLCCLKKLYKIIICSLLIIIILIGLYFSKKDSADGRLLIWHCTANMIIDKPFLGHGVGGFQSEYMLYQADYFRNHPESCYSMLSDIVKDPFNEFLLLLVEHGLVGGLFLIFFLYYLFKEYRRSKNNESFYALLCLVCIGVFSCFSYPLRYPFIRLMAVFCAAFIMRNETRSWIMPKGLFSVLKPTVLVVSISFLILTEKMFYDEFQWNKIAQRSLSGETKKMLLGYAQLYKTMNKNGLFLYNYGAELNFIGECRKSTTLLKECANFYNDIDLQLLLAGNYTKLKNYREAEKCLILAHEMIPNRFIPLYRLVMLYKKTGKDVQAYQLAKIIVKMPIKVISVEVITIRSEMKNLIEKKVNN